jgi:hypothetical protein
MAGFLDALGALNNQGVFAGLGAMGNGMYTGQGAGGYAPGAQQYLMGQQQLQAARLQNMFQQAMMPTKLGLLQSASGAMQNSPAAGGSGAALGAPGAVGGPGGPAAPGPQGGGGMLNSANPMLPASELHALAMYAAANGDTRGAANLLNQIEQRAGGAGYNLDASGGAYATPGGAKDPRVLGTNSMMEEAGKQSALTAPGATQNLGYQFQRSLNDASGSALGAMAPGGRNDPRIVYQENLARSAGTGAGGAPYEAPFTIDAPGPDGVNRTYTVPRAQAPQLNGFGAGAPPQPMSVQDYLGRLQGQEGGSNPNAGSMRSSALGPWQDTAATFVPRARQYAPTETAGKSDQQVMQMATDPGFGSMVNGALTRDNAQSLSKAGLPVTAGTLSLAHFLGAGDAAKALQADPRTPASAVLPSNVIQANPQLRRATIGDVVASRGNTMGNAPVDLRYPGQSGPTSAMVPGGGLIPGKPIPTPEQSEASKGLGERSNAIADAGAKAPQAMVQLNTLQTALDQYRTGSDAQTRQQAGKTWLSALGTLGFTPSKDLQERVAAGETIDKISGMLTTEIARSMGSREAASVVNSIAQRMPSLDKSPQGNQVLVGALRQNLQRDQDLAAFREQWLADPRHGGSIQGMESQFNRVHPSEVYSSKALPLSVPSNKQQLTLGALYKGPGGHVGMWNGQGFDTDQANWGVR